MTKREQRTIEALKNNELLKEQAFYCLNERFVSNLTGDIIFATRSLDRFRNKHLARGIYKTWTGSDRIGLTKPGPDRIGLTKPGSDCVRLTTPGPDPKKSDRHKFQPK